MTCRLRQIRRGIVRRTLWAFMRNGEDPHRTDLLWSFQKYPDLHVVMTEGYALWLAGVMQFCDHHWEGRFGAPSRAMIDLEALPSFL